MSKELIIIGAGGDGRNVADVVRDLSDDWKLLGFLDDDPAKQGKEINGVRVLGKIDNLEKYRGCYFTILVGTAGRVKSKKNLIAKLGLKPDEYATIIHPSAKISPSASIGKGTVILPMVTVMANAYLGDFVFVASKTNIGHDAKIFDYTLLSAMVGIAGGVTVREGAYIGISSCIREGINVGEWSIVGIGSVVVKDVKPYTIVAGNPAKSIGKADTEE